MHCSADGGGRRCGAQSRGPDRDRPHPSSPLYSAETDRFLLLDAPAYKYSPIWLSTESFMESNGGTRRWLVKANPRLRDGRPDGMRRAEPDRHAYPRMGALMRPGRHRDGRAAAIWARRMIWRRALGTPVCSTETRFACKKTPSTASAVTWSDRRPPGCASSVRHRLRSRYCCWWCGARYGNGSSTCPASALSRSRRSAARDPR